MPRPRAWTDSPSASRRPGDAGVFQTTFAGGARMNEVQLRVVLMAVIFAIGAAVFWYYARKKG